MSQPSDHPDQTVYEQLARWLREAAAEPSCQVDEHLAEVRRTLLAQLEVAPSAATRLARQVSQESAQAPQPYSNLTRFRIALGTIGAVAAAIALVMVALNTPGRLSAMERTARQLSEVKSYRYRLAWQATWLEDDGKRSLTTKGDGMTYWRAPDAFHNDLKIVKTTEDAASGNRTEEIIEDFAEIFPTGGHGVMIDYLRKTYFRQAFEPTGSKTYPWEVLRMIREGSYDVQRELGARQIDGTAASGYVLALKNPRVKNPVRWPVELWVDAKTDLPLEFIYRGTSAGSTYWDRTTDFQWNIELDAKWFDATPPAGFDDITPPSAEQDLDQITAALRLYADLSGGNYPRTKTMDAKATVDAMKTMAGFAGPQKPEWTNDKAYQQIEQATAGLNWIERILRIRFLSGYRGDEVRSIDKDKVLLWWVGSDNQYRVFYGDLRSEIVSEEQWSKLVEAGATAGAK